MQYIKLALLDTLLCFVCNVSEVHSQNLVRNGSFEETYPFIYEFPFSAFEYLKYWEAASFQFFDSSLITTPDLFIQGEIIPPSIPPTFWNITSGASDGRNYVGLRNTATQDGAFLPEAISAELLMPLKAGEYYSINLDYRNKGHDLHQNNAVLCVKEELKKIIFYFDDNKVTVKLNEIENISTPSTNQKIEFHTTSMKSYQVSNWEKVGTCFQALGNEIYFAVSMTTGRVQVNPPCIILDDYFDDFLHYYFDIDDIQIKKLPETLFVESTICHNRSKIISLKDSLDLPVMMQDIKFIMDGKNADDLITVTQEGIYFGEVQLDCTKIPIQLTVTELNCEPLFFIPNVFSPNLDGINDNWKISVITDVSIDQFRLSLFDRWGNEVFNTNDTLFEWGGMKEGQVLNQGVYSYFFEYEYVNPLDGPIKQIQKGELLLIR